MTDFILLIVMYIVALFSAICCIITCLATVIIGKTVFIDVCQRRWQDAIKNALYGLLMAVFTAAFGLQSAYLFWEVLSH